MTALVTENVALLAGGPGANRRLRDLVLALAATGKLVPQRAADGPGSNLLAEIKTLRAANRSRKEPDEFFGDEQIAPFDLPRNWVPARLGEIVDIVRGITFPASEKTKTPGEGKIACLRTSNVQHSVEWDDILFVDEKFVGREDQLLRPADIVMSMANSRDLVGKVALVTDMPVNRASFGGFLGVIRPLLVEPRFVMTLLRTPSARRALIDGASQTTNIANISLAKLRPLPVAVPPLAEQRRIVAKVDEMMALCDRLEARQQNAEAAHTKLVQALLDSLTQARDADDFRASWQRLAGQFEAIFTTSISVDALRRSILHLAADGRLVSEGATAPQLPIGDLLVCDTLNGCSYKPSDEPGGTAILRISAGTGSDDFYVDEADHKWVVLTDAEREKFRLLPNDLLACRFNGNLRYVGSFSLYRNALGLEQVFPDKLIRFRVDPRAALPDYLRFVMNSALTRSQIEGFCATTVGNIGISASNLKTVKVRVPPLDEQHLIVAKVTELFALCDQLKARIATARAKHAQLAEALVAQAVAA